MRRHVAVIMMLGALAAPLSAARAAPVSLAECARIAADAARLACYDALAGTAGGPAAAPAAPAVPAAAGAAQLEAAFGTESIKKPEPRPAAEIEEIRSALLERPEELIKGMRIGLENGQIWRYTDDRSLYVPAKARMVVIRRNFLGNYFLSLDDSSVARRVRREQ